MTEAVGLTEFIVAEVHRQTGEEAVRKLVEVKIADAIEGAVDRAFRFGDLRKQIDQAVTNSLAIGDRVDVPGYGNMVMAMLRAKMDEVLGGIVNERLSVEMTEILSLAPKQVKLSDLVASMTKELEHQDRFGSSVTCEVEESDYGSFWIHIDEQPDKRRYDCAMTLGISREGKIFHLTIDKKDAKQTVVLGAYEDYKKLAFAAYCCGSKFIVDEEFVVRGIGDD